MAKRIRRYRPDFDMHASSIGCIALIETFFLAEHLWVAQPSDWSRSGIQVGKTYDTNSPIGGELWTRVQGARAATTTAIGARDRLPEADRYGPPIRLAPRLGQGGFRARVLDAYERRCSVTNERTLPVLEAAHIRPYAQSGPHAVDNGLLLRRDLHTLFDRGYVTVTPGLEFRVSHRIRDEFENGRDYDALDRRQVRLPARPNPGPAREFLEVAR